VHLEKAFTAPRAKALKPGLFGPIKAMAADKMNWTEADLRAGITPGLTEAYANGQSAQRNHARLGHRRADPCRSRRGRPCWNSASTTIEARVVMVRPTPICFVDASTIGWRNSL